MGRSQLLGLLLLSLSFTSAVSAAIVPGDFVQHPRYRIRRRAYLQNTTSQASTDTVTPLKPPIADISPPSTIVTTSNRGDQTSLSTASILLSSTTASTSIGADQTSLTPTNISPSSTIVTTSNGEDQISFATTAVVSLNPPRPPIQQSTFVSTSDVNITVSPPVQTRLGTRLGTGESQTKPTDAITPNQPKKSAPSAGFSVLTQPNPSDGYSLILKNPRPSAGFSTLALPNPVYGNSLILSTLAQPNPSGAPIQPNSGYFPGKYVPTGAFQGASVNCSGTRSINPSVSTIIVTATSTISNYTTTIQAGDSIPAPVLIFPPPFCTTNVVKEGPLFAVPHRLTFGAQPAPEPAFLTFSTELVIKKNPVVVVQSSIPDLYPPAKLSQVTPTVNGNPPAQNYQGSANPGKSAAPAPANQPLPVTVKPTPTPNAGQNNPPQNGNPSNSQPGTGGGASSGSNDNGNVPGSSQAQGSNGGSGSGSNQSPGSNSGTGSGSNQPPGSNGNTPSSNQPQGSNGGSGSGSNQSPGSNSGTGSGSTQPQGSNGNAPGSNQPQGSNGGSGSGSNQSPGSNSGTGSGSNQPQGSNGNAPGSNQPQGSNGGSGSGSNQSPGSNSGTGSGSTQPQGSNGNAPGSNQPQGSNGGSGSGSNQSPGSNSGTGSGSNQPQGSNGNAPGSNQPQGSNGGSGSGSNQSSGSNSGTGSGSNQPQGSNGNAPGSNQPQGSNGGNTPGSGQPQSGSDGTVPGSGQMPEAAGKGQAPSVVTVGNIPVSIGPAGVVINSQTIPAGASRTAVVVNGESIVVEPSQIVFPETTIPLIVNRPAPTKSVTLGNVPVVLQPDNVVIGTRTFTPGVNVAPIVDHGQTFHLDASQFSSPETTIDLPKPGAPSVAAAGLVTAGGQVFRVGFSQVQAPGLTVALPTDAKASSFVYKGQTFEVNPSQIIAPDRTIGLPQAQQTPSHAVFVYNGQTLSVEGSKLITPSTTIDIPGGSGTVVYNGQTLTIGPSQIAGPSTTIQFRQIPAGITAAPSITIAAGHTFALGPSAAVFGSLTYSFLPGQAPTTILDHGQVVTIGPNGVQIGGTTIPVPAPPPNFSLVTAGGLTFSVAPSEAVIGGHTFTVGSDNTPTTTVINGQTISIGPHGIGLASTTVALPGAEPTFSPVTAGGLTFSVAQSEAIIGGRTYTIGSDSAPTTTVVNGQTISIGPHGIGLASTTVALPGFEPSFSAVTAGGLTFSVAASEAVIGGHTFTIGPGSKATTTVINGQTISIGPHGIGLATTTVALPPSQSSFSIVTEGDLTFSLSPSEAVIGGKTFTVGPGSVPITTVLNGETITIGPSGIGLKGTTAALPTPTGAQTPSAVTVDGLTFSVEPTDVIISGTTYPIGVGATPTTIVVGTETISLGPGGIGLPSTTIPVPSSPSSTGSTKHSGALSQIVSANTLLLSALPASFVLLVFCM